MKRSTNFQQRMPAGGGVLGRAALALSDLKAQNVRLREALEKVRDSHCGDPECGCCGMDRLTAVDALETGKE